MVSGFSFPNSSVLAANPAAFGVAGDLPVTGDWNGDNKTEIGIWRPSNHSFYLDLNGSNSWDSGDLSFKFGIADDQPIAGDWNNDGKDEVGVYRPSNQSFYLDHNDNNAWDGENIDKYFSFGVAGDLPVTGDWNGDGKTEIGIWRPSNYNFYLDLNGSNSWDSGDLSFKFGIADDQPIAGDWNGDNKTEIGIWRPSESKFYLDVNASNSWDNSDIEFKFGIAGDQPMAGNWSGGEFKAGIFRSPGIFYFNICVPKQILGNRICNVDGLGWTEFSITVKSACNNNETQGCRVCKSDGSGWTDINAKCNMNERCSNGTCIPILLIKYAATDEIFRNPERGFSVGKGLLLDTDAHVKSFINGTDAEWNDAIRGDAGGCCNWVRYG